MKEAFRPSGNYENSKCIKSITPCGGKQNDKQKLVFWCVGASLARVAAGSIGTSDIFLSVLWESKLVLKTYLTSLFVCNICIHVYMYIYICQMVHTQAKPCVEGTR